MLDGKDTADEEKDILVGIDPDDTDTLKMGGAVFTLGVVPAGIWERLTIRRNVAIQNSMRRTIAKLSSEGKDPDELVMTVKDDGRDVTRAVFDCQHDIVFIGEMAVIHMEAVAYGVKAHKNFVNRHDVPFPFETEKTDLEGEEVMRMAKKTRRLYGANLKLLERLYLGLLKLNEFGRLAKKD